MPNREVPLALVPLPIDGADRQSDDMARTTPPTGAILKIRFVCLDVERNRNGVAQVGKVLRRAPIVFGYAWQGLNMRSFLKNNFAFLEKPHGEPLEWNVVV